MMATNSKSKILFLLLSLAGYLLINGCSVGAKVKLNAANIEYPVSQTNSFYTANNRLILPGQYEVEEEFSFTFTKWGVSSPIEIKSEEDISNRLNAIIQQHNGDAIVDLTISVHNPPVRNGLLWFTKTVAFWTALIFTPLTLIEPKSDHAIIAASSIGLYMFTPATAIIKVEGKVVRLIE